MWAIDPKGAIELGRARALFGRFYGDEFEAMAKLLEGRHKAGWRGALGPDVVGLAARSG